MRRILVATAVFASLAFTAQANDGVDVPVRKLVVSSSTAVWSSKPVEAPFTSARVDPLAQILMMEEQERRSLPTGCDAAATTLCFDADGRVVYRGARKFMPEISGLRAEISGMNLRAPR